MENKTEITTADFFDITSGCTLQPDGRILVNSTALSAMCRIVDSMRGISKESNESTRVDNPDKRKRTNLKDAEILASYVGKIQKVIPDLLLELEEMNSQSSNGKKKVITPEIVAERIGLGNKVVRRNATLFSAYNEIIKGYIGQPLFDNEYKN